MTLDTPLTKTAKSRRMARADGFTLVETLIVLVLIAIFTVMVAAALHDHEKARQVTAGDVLAAHIAFAQLRSMGTTQSWGIKYSAGRYWLFRHPDSDTPRPLPGETDLRVAVAANVSISPNTFTTRFDEWGRPFNTTTPLSADMTLRIATPGAADLPLTIVAETGFVRWLF